MASVNLRHERFEVSLQDMDHMVPSVDTESSLQMMSGDQCAVEVNKGSKLTQVWLEAKFSKYASGCMVQTYLISATSTASATWI